MKLCMIHSLAVCRRNIYRQDRKIKREENYAYLWVDNLGTIKLTEGSEDKIVYVLRTPVDIDSLM
jgi:hypothetical protein